MPMPFNADEIFEMAQQIERNGAKFYRAAAKIISSLKEMLLELADMEDQHLATFTDMRSRLTEAEKEPLVFDPDGQAQMYLRVMASNHVFDTKADSAKMLSGKKAKDILKMAIGLEKDSIVFYSALKESVSRKSGKDKVEAIISEEMSHIVILGDKLAALK